MSFIHFNLNVMPDLALKWHSLLSGLAADSHCVLVHGASWNRTIHVCIFDLSGVGVLCLGEGLPPQPYIPWIDYWYVHKVLGKAYD